MLSSSFPSSFLLVVIIAVIIVSITTIIPTSEAKLLSTIIEMFDIPNSMLLDQQQYAVDSALCNADKTREFLAFGDAAMDYYVN